MPQAIQTDRDYHWQRRLFHFGSCFLMFICTVLFSEAVVWGLYFVVAVPLFILDLYRQSSKGLNHATIKLLGPILRRSEVHALSGASFSILGVGLTYLIFPAPMNQLALLYLAVGDPAASLIGLRLGGPKIWGKKSWSGFLGAWLLCAVSTALFFFFQPNPFEPFWWLILSFSASGALAETLCLPKIDDNLTQPLLSATFMSLLAKTMGAL